MNDWIYGQVLSGQSLIPQTNALDAKAIGGDFAIPVFVIQGAEDFTTPTSLARDFVNSIRAPRKTFVAIDGGGHFAVFAFVGYPTRAWMTLTADSTRGTQHPIRTEEHQPRRAVSARACPLDSLLLLSVRREPFGVMLRASRDRQRYAGRPTSS